MDSQGRYSLVEIRERVRRRLNAYQATVDPTTGDETGLLLADQLISNIDLNEAINESMTSLYADAIELRPDPFATEKFIDIQENVSDYAIPLGTIQIRWVRYRDANTSTTPSRPSDWIPMHEISDPNDYDLQVGQFPAPTYRRVGDVLKFNDPPTRALPQGLWLGLIAIPPELSQDSDVIQGKFARVFQQATIFDVALTLGETRLERSNPYIAGHAQYWRQKAITISDHATHPDSVQMVSERLVANSFTGRRRQRGATIPSR